ncbi:outer membrane beta-barrel protein [Microbulbifer sp. SAOS-129_SWC]|uniref:outer membrane beta-barrel protein n=1 Tax=Microbulbifer sp. SAOS-129_SWC TaxID=3145235 RepID=UPI00321702AC
MTKIRLSVMIGVIVSIGAGSALADSEAAAVKLGNGIELTPSLNVDFQNDDNVTNASSSQIESVVTLVNPNFQLSAGNDVSDYNLTYSLEKGAYFDSSADNYLDQTVSGEGNWELNERNHFSLAGSYLAGHEARGTGISQGFGNLLDEPDTYKENDVHGLYSYGAEGAKGRIDVTVGSGNHNYDGNELRVRTHDRGTNYGTLGFSYNAGGKTRLLAEASLRDIAYDYTAPGVAPLDSTETDFLVGISWEGTAKTTGRIKVGASRKAFDSAARGESTMPSWEVGVGWTPRTYSTFDLSTKRHSQETNGAGNYIDVQTYRLGWTHEWAERLSTEVAYAHTNNQYEGVQREENIDNTSLEANYVMRRWLSLRAGVSLDKQNSNQANFDYDKNLTYIGFELTL